MIALIPLLDAADILVESKDGAGEEEGLGDFKSCVFHSIRSCCNCNSLQLQR